MLEHTILSKKFLAGAKSLVEPCFFFFLKLAQIYGVSAVQPTAQNFMANKKPSTALFKYKKHSQN